MQTKLYELEGQMRRGAAERGAVELKKTEYEEEVQRQREQMSHMESLYKRQLEGSQNVCSQDKVMHQRWNFNEDIFIVFGCYCSNPVHMKEEDTLCNCVLAFRANCKATFPPVPKQYRNSKVQTIIM